VSTLYLYSIWPLTSFIWQVNSDYNLITNEGFLISTGSPCSHLCVHLFDIFSLPFPSNSTAVIRLKLNKMATNGIAKGINKGHITKAITRKPKPSHRKGVSFYWSIKFVPTLFRYEHFHSKHSLQDEHLMHAGTMPLYFTDATLFHVASQMVCF